MQQAAQDSAGIPIGRFVARIVPPGGLLYLGTDRSFTREPREYEAKQTIIEIYDSRYAGSVLGQFVSSYGAKTLASRAPIGRLAMQGGIDEWTMSEAETAALCELARAQVTEDL